MDVLYKLQQSQQVSSVWEYRARMTELYEWIVFAESETNAARSTVYDI